MDILLIAYDFPPVPSPQSLRWAYLTRELALAGHRVRVITPDQPGYGSGGLPEQPPGVEVLRVYPGPFTNFLNRPAKRWMQAVEARSLQAELEVDPPASTGEASSAEPVGVLTHAGQSSMAAAMALPAVELNWKGRLRHRLEDAARGVSSFVSTLPARISGSVPDLRSRLGSRRLGVRESLKSFLGLWMFPDVRAEWIAWARRQLDEALIECPPDAVITSHEPPNSIVLGLHAKRRGFRWIADLGDPVLAPYTPKRWKKRAHELEQALCEHADMVTVTSRGAARILNERHGLPESRCALVTQGYDAGFVARPRDAGGVEFDPQRLELLYTGSFYSFRRVGNLLGAVLDTPGVRLSVATIVAPPDIVAAAREHPDRVRLLGFLSHRQALALQRRCDVLVNLANDDPVQIPGKLYEYLGAGVPVLHVGGRNDDAASLLLERTGVGVCEPDAYDDLATRLSKWRGFKSMGKPLVQAVSQDASQDYRWDRLAARVVAVCRGEAVP